ncbi:HEAT repeat domain-containing protein [Planctomicrobium sp. SH668]|uniref:HEAT repeat domain-containing protein n=1 Tax=Planctomicrobium sp. SH668 TaxID=3448126 RepID=UPI003F5B4B1E
MDRLQSDLQNGTTQIGNRYYGKSTFEELGSLKRIACPLFCLGLLLTGCQQEQKPQPSVPAIEQVVTSTTADSPGLIEPSSARELKADSIVQKPDDSVARQLFEQLLAPQSDASSWDELHDKLVQQGESAVRVLAENIGSESTEAKELAVSTLVLFGPDAAPAREALLNCLNDPNEFVQSNAVAALLQIPDQTDEVLPTLLKLLKADDPQLRIQAAFNLNATGTSDANLIASIQDALNIDQPEEVFTQLFEVAGRIGPPAESLIPRLERIAQEQTGDLGSAAQTAIQLINGEMPAIDDSNEDTPSE